ncbi:hypothetical protein [Nocardia suismassiliense]|uniref:hypothetical protein n=1 Tax=Nocardia suismassiliense TaxID=2077092 RepID=UPI000D1EB22E|nr:hypothetical protein [Nocardia suismassiliense]
MDNTATSGAEIAFKKVWAGCWWVVCGFLVAFVVVTILKMICSPRDITVGWFSAWGTWAAGIATAAAFLIAAYGIMVSSAQARADRLAAAEVRESDAMAQARLLTIYHADSFLVPDVIKEFRIENRSRERFFDVSVPFVDRVYKGEPGRVMPQSPSSTGQVLETLPNKNLLHPHLTENGAWFTDVRVYADDTKSVTFEVQYTDAAGLAWRQHSDGRIERGDAHTAIQVREVDQWELD